MRRIAWAGLALLLVAAAAAAAWKIWRPASPSPGIVDASGRIEGDQAALGAKVGGKIVRMAVREGNEVKAGQLIAQLAA